jgi:hypothetical protein
LLGLQGAKPLGLTCLKTFALDALALHFAGAADGFGGFAGAAFGGFFVVPAEFHFTEHAFTLKLFLERLQRLVDVIVANENLHLAGYSLKNRSVGLA